VEYSVVPLNAQFHMEKKDEALTRRRFCSFDVTDCSRCKHLRLPMNLSIKLILIYNLGCNEVIASEWKLECIGFPDICDSEKGDTL
jgi:hypothetical protein